MSTINLTNAKAIIHAVGPNFRVTPKAFKELYDAYYNSLKVMMDNGYHSISFPLISSEIFGGSLSLYKQMLAAATRFKENKGIKLGGKGDSVAEEFMFTGPLYKKYMDFMNWRINLIHFKWIEAA